MRQNGRSKMRKLLNQKGFSLVELMVVVAIIGILASIAIPNYQRFQRKALQSGGKGELGGLYTAERVFVTEWGFGSSDMFQLGYATDGSSKYSVGWPGNTTQPAGSATDYNAASATFAPGYNGPSVRTGTAGSYNSHSPLPTELVAIGTTVFPAVNDNAFQASVTCAGLTQAGGCTSGTDCFCSDRSGCAWSSSTCTGTYQSPGLMLPAGTYNQIDFVIGAIGQIGGANPDAWFITAEKTLINSQVGL